MDLKLQMKQTQTLFQRVIQLAGILRMTSQELNIYTNDLALENPVIDTAEPPAKTQQRGSIKKQQRLNFFDGGNYYLYQRQDNDDDYDFRSNQDINTDDGETFQDYLWSQLVTGDFSQQGVEIIEFMLKSSDNKGYLSENTDDIVIYFKAGVTLAEKFPYSLQELDPAGVCTRDLEERLTLRLEQREMLTPILVVIIDNCLKMVTKNQTPAIACKLHLSLAEAAGYCQIIKSPNPKSEVFFSSREKLRCIIPDVIIVKFKEYSDILPDESMYSNIGINSCYSRMSRDPSSPELREYLSSKIRQAEWVKQYVAQRSRTLMQMSKALLKYQEGFSIYGPSHLAPLKLADAVQELDIHESTVSRVVSGEYLQCSRGVHPMNFFSSHQASVQENASGSQSSQAATAADIKRAPRKITNVEGKKKSYSDRLLGEKLGEHGITTSRRTAVGYREEEETVDVSGGKEYV